MDFDILVVGDVVIDIIADLGYPFSDIAFAASTDVRAGKIVPGGGGNVASALSYLGAKTVFLGKCGDDALCDFYENDLKSYGTFPLLFRSKFKSTGYVISLLSSNAERTMIVYPGANEDLSIDEIDRSRSVLDRASCLFIHGYSLQRKKQSEALIHLADIFYNDKKRVFVDPSTTTLIRNNREVLEKVLNKTFGLLLNYDEAVALTGGNSLEEVVEKLKDVAELVALKLGHKGSLVIENGKPSYFKPYFVRPVDTTGAGDSYDAAFLAVYLKEKNVEKAADFANWFSAMTITKYGPRSFPSRKEVESKLFGE